jgi:hypothetical protein
MCSFVAVRGVGGGRFGSLPDLGAATAAVSGWGRLCAGRSRATDPVIHSRATPGRRTPWEPPGRSSWFVPLRGSCPWCMDHFGPAGADRPSLGPVKRRWAEEALRFWTGRSTRRAVLDGRLRAVGASWCGADVDPLRHGCRSRPASGGGWVGGRRPAARGCRLAWFPPAADRRSTLAPRSPRSAASAARAGLAG